MDTRERRELAALLDRTATGDVDAFARYYDRTSASAFRLALLTVDGDAADVVHDAYARAWRERLSFRSSRLSPVAWILALTQASADTFSRRRRQE